MPDRNEVYTGLREKVGSIFSTRGKLVIFIFIIYGISIPLSLQGPNPTSRFLLTKSIVERGVFWFPIEYLDENSTYWLSPDYAEIDDKLYSDKPPGLSFLAVPVFIISKMMVSFLHLNLEALFPNLNLHPDNDHIAVAGIQLTLCLLAAIGILRIFDICQMMGISERNSLLAGLITAFTTPYWVYARTMFNHVPAAVFLISSFYHIQKYRRDKKIVDLLLAGFFSGFGFSIEFSIVFSIPWMCVLLLLPISSQIPEWKEKIASFIVYGLATGISALPLFYYNFVNFGDILANALSFSHWASILHLLEPVHEGLYVLLLSNTRGLLYFSPIVLFGIAGLFLAYRRYPIEVSVIFSLILYVIIFYAKKYESHGGAAFGPRYLVPILLVLGIGFGWILENITRSNLAQGALIITGVWSFLTSFLGSFYSILIFGSYPFSSNFQDPIFEETLNKFLTGDIWQNSNVPLFQQFPYEFLAISLALIAIFISNTLLYTSKQRIEQKTPKTKNHLQGYFIFSLGNLIFMFLFFTQICYILSRSYIVAWEESTGKIFKKLLPASELWLLLAFMILLIHSSYLIISEYSVQIRKLLLTIKKRISSEKEP